MEQRFAPPPDPFHSYLNEREAAGKAFPRTAPPTPMQAPPNALADGCGATSASRRPLCEIVQFRSGGRGPPMAQEIRPIGAGPLPAQPAKAPRIDSADDRNSVGGPFPTVPHPARKPFPPFPFPPVKRADIHYQLDAARWCRGPLQYAWLEGPFRSFPRSWKAGPPSFIQTHAGQKPWGAGRPDAQFPAPKIL